MAAKRTYSVRLDDDQRQQLEARAGGKLAVGNLIRCAIDDYLRQEEQRDYLSDVEARIAATINRLARQVEKDRAEQQMIMGVLSFVREWLAFTLPPPADMAAAQVLAAERERVFRERVPLHFESYSKANLTTYLEKNDSLAEPCPACGTGRLKRKQGKKGLFWYCTNWNATPKCDATFADANGRPLMPNEEGTDA